MFRFVEDMAKLNTEGTFVLTGYTNLFGECVRMRYFATWSDIMTHMKSYKQVVWYVSDDDLRVSCITPFNKVDMLTVRRVTTTSKIRSKISDKDLEKITKRIGSEVTCKE